METETDKKIKTWKEWKKLSGEKKVHEIMERMSDLCDHWEGEKYQIRWGHVIHAEVGYKDIAELTIQPIKEWVEENQMWVTDYLEE